MICPNCKHEWKDEAKAAGGKKSRRRISPEAQAKMQAGRKKPEAEGNSRDQLGGT